jgi:hypothetical protein
VTVGRPCSSYTCQLYSDIHTRPYELSSTHSPHPGTRTDHAVPPLSGYVQDGRSSEKSKHPWQQGCQLNHKQLAPTVCRMAVMSDECESIASSATCRWRVPHSAWRFNCLPRPPEKGFRQAVPAHCMLYSCVLSPFDAETQALSARCLLPRSTCSDESARLLLTERLRHCIDPSASRLTAVHVSCAASINAENHGCAPYNCSHQ